MTAPAMAPTPASEPTSTLFIWVGRVAADVAFLIDIETVGVGGIDH